MKFDPYRKWLGIPPEEQPPNHYRLLGVGLFESDPDVISNAADRQMAHVRTYQSGKYSKVSQKLLNELSAARVVLLDGKKREAYDEKLKKHLPAKPPGPPAARPSPPPPKAAGGAPPGAAPSPPKAGGAAAFPTGPARPTVTKYAARRKKPSWQGPVITIVLLAVLLVAVVLILNRPGSTNGPKKPRRPAVQRPPVHSVEPAPGQRTGEPEEHPAPEHPPDSGGKGPVEVAVAEAGAGTAPETFIDRAPKLEDKVGEIRVFSGHVDRVTAVAFSPDGGFFVSGSEGRAIFLWDVESGVNRRFESTRHPVIDPVLGVDMSANGFLVAAVSGQASPPDHGKLHVWNTAGGEPTIFGSLDEIGAAADVAFSPDGRHLALAALDSTVQLLDITKQDRTKARALAGHQGPVLSVAFTPDSSQVVSGSRDRTVRVWGVSSGSLARTLNGHTDHVTSVAVSSDGKRALSASRDGTLRLWPLDSDGPPRVFAGHDGAVLDAAFSPDGHYALSAGEDGTVRYWDLATGGELWSLTGHSGPVVCVAFAPGGRHAVSGGADHTIRLFGLPDPATLARPEHPLDMAEGAGQRQPVPDAATQEPIEERIREETYREEFASLEKPSDWAALTGKLLAAGKQSADSPAESFVLLRLAGDVAAKSGNADAVVAAGDAIGRRFEADTMVLKLAWLEQVAKVRAGDTRSNKLLLGEIFLDAADEAMAAGDLDSAKQLVDGARPLGAGDAAFGQRVAAAAKAVEAIESGRAAAQSARQTLAAKPGDPAASEALGRFLCFLRGDWEEGLPHLAAAPDANLQFLARTDATGPEQPGEQLRLADGWWALAEKQSGRARQQIALRAARWYRAAEPSLAGPDKARAQLRLEEARDPAALLAGPAEAPATEGLACRREPAKSAMLRALGGTPQSEAAVDAALAWLADHQYLPQGGWSFNHETPRHRGKAENVGRMAEAPNAATSLALMAFLGAGHGPKGSGEYRTNVFTGVRFLMAQLAARDSLYEVDPKPVPSHALGTIALCETCAAADDPRSRRAAEFALKVLVDTQNGDGGWGYRPKQVDPVDPDTSAMFPTVWSIAALRTARWVELDVPDAALRKAERFLDRMQDAEKKGYLARVPTPEEVDTIKPDRNATAGAYLARMYLGWGTDRASLSEFALSQPTPTAGRFLYNYDLTYILRNFGDEAWNRWNTAIRDQLVQSQTKDGPESGSWFQGGGPFNDQGGRLYCTAMATLILENYYRQPLLEQ